MTGLADRARLPSAGPVGGLADRLATADLGLPALTAEELGALGRDGVPVPLPVLDGLAPAALAAALDAGRRSLLARGLLLADGTHGPALRAVAALRAHPEVRVVAEGPSGTVWWHAAPSGVVLEERPGPDGVHQLLLRPRRRAAAALAAAADPEDRAAAGPGTSDPDRAVATATTVTRVAAARRRPGRPPVLGHLTVAAGPLGAWVVTGTARDGGTGERRAVAAPVDGAGLAGVLLLLFELPERDAYMDSGAVTPSIPSPTTNPSLADSTSHSRAAVSSGGTPSPIT